MLVGKRRFENYFSDFKTKGRDLLLTMSSLELFPPRRGDALKGDDVPDNYASAQVTSLFKVKQDGKILAFSKETYFHFTFIET